MGKKELPSLAVDIRLWKWLASSSHPFMEMVVQLRLTACATASYGLWKWLASSSPHLWNCLCNPVLQIVQPSLTDCATASYGLWKWLVSSFPHLWKRF